MKIARRILIVIGALFTVLYVVPAALVSLYFHHSVETAPAFVKVVPTDLGDLTISQAPGTKLSFVGYEFEVPWTDFDESQTKTLNNEPADDLSWVCFRSGLKLFLAAEPLQPYPEYEFEGQIYAINPDKISYWALITGKHYRDLPLLLVKSDNLRHVGFDPESSPSENGIFNIQSHGYKGFQYGDPQKWHPELDLKLYSADGRVKIQILQKDYDDPMGVTQPEINRIVQSLHKDPSSETSISPAAASK